MLPLNSPNVFGFTFICSLWTWCNPGRTTFFLALTTRELTVIFFFTVSVAALDGLSLDAAASRRMQHPEIALQLQGNRPAAAGPVPFCRTPGLRHSPARAPSTAHDGFRRFPRSARPPRDLRPLPRTCDFEQSGTWCERVKSDMTESGNQPRNKYRCSESDLGRNERFWVE